MKSIIEPSQNPVGGTSSHSPHRIPYGPDKSQFGDLWLPDLAPKPNSPAPSHTPPPEGRSPVIVFLHGGWWQSEYDLEYSNALCAALASESLAVWSLEYRRVGATGGGWPTTFQDVAVGFNHLATLAPAYPIDLTRVLAVGHSAGGHLAFWLAGRHHVAESNELHAAASAPGPALRGVIALAGAVDLRLTIDLAGYFTFAHDKQEVYSLMGGTPAQYPDRYRAGNPGDLLPFNIPQVLIQGDRDDQIPAALPTRWAENARTHGEHVTVTMLPGIGHMDVTDPGTRAFPTLRAAIHTLLAA